MPQRKEFSEAEEMQLYGFDPTSEADLAAFHATDPQDPNLEIDYSEDSFEFGGQVPRTPDPGQQA